MDRAPEPRKGGGPDTPLGNGIRQGHPIRPGRAPLSFRGGTVEDERNGSKCDRPAIPDRPG